MRVTKSERDASRGGVVWTPPPGARSKVDKYDGHLHKYWPENVVLDTFELVKSPPKIAELTGDFYSGKIVFRISSADWNLSDNKGLGIWVHIAIYEALQGENAIETEQLKEWKETEPQGSWRSRLLGIRWNGRRALGAIESLVRAAGRESALGIGDDGSFDLENAVDLAASGDLHGMLAVAHIDLDTEKPDFVGLERLEASNRE